MSGNRLATGSFLTRIAWCATTHVWCGCRWFRAYLGEDTSRPLRHPEIPTYVDYRNMGTTVKIKPRDRTATLIPSVGCPLGCNFCVTSAMFGGKGKFVNFRLAYDLKC